MEKNTGVQRREREFLFVCWGEGDELEKEVATLDVIYQALVSKLG